GSHARGLHLPGGRGVHRSRRLHRARRDPSPGVEALPAVGDQGGAGGLPRQAAPRQDRAGPAARGRRGRRRCHDRTEEPGMRIAAIDLFRAELPYSGGVYRLSRGRTYESFDAAIVRLTAEDGTQGWGESTPFGSTYVAAHARGTVAGIEELAPVVLGQDPRRVDR